MTSTKVAVVEFACSYLMRSLVWEGGDSTTYYPIIASAWTMARVSIITKKVLKSTEKYWKVWSSKKYKSRSYHPIIASVDTPLSQGAGVPHSLLLQYQLDSHGWHWNRREYMGFQLFVCLHAAPGPIMGSTWELNSLWSICAPTARNAGGKPWY